MTPPDLQTFMDASQIQLTLEQMQVDLRTHLAARQIDTAAMIGIHTGGVWIAKILHEALALTDPLGVLDINFYRDDFSRSGVNPQVRPSNIQFDVDGRHIVLVDDVVQSGRTIRAAMNEIFDYGRPASITLAVLVDRDGRQLPVQPDIVGCRPQLQNSQHVRLNGPEPLSLCISPAKTPRGNPDEV